LAQSDLFLSFRDWLTAMSPRPACSQVSSTMGVEVIAGTPKEFDGTHGRGHRSLEGCD